MAFDPSNPSNIYAGSDGGVFFPPDTGATWEHRNHGLNTLQCYCLSNHPQWAAVILFGTQDNGGAFSTAAPAWILDQLPGQSHNEIEGDIVAVAIDYALGCRRHSQKATRNRVLRGRKHEQYHLLER